MAKNNQNKYVILSIIALLAIYVFLVKPMPLGPKQATIKVTNNGAEMKALIVDENGNVKYDLSQVVGTQIGETFAIISAPTPSGYLSISNSTCVSGCSFLAVSTRLVNSGAGIVTITGVTSTNPCSLGNTNPSCGSITNVLAGTGTRQGFLNTHWSNNITPSIYLVAGNSSKTIISQPMSVDAIALGMIDFRVDVSGTFIDSFGDPQPLTGVNGSLVLRLIASKCSDNTDVDPTSGNADEFKYCSVPTKGKYCRVGSTGQPTLTDRAVLCGCPPGQIANGQVCVASSCTPNSCMPNSINFCLGDGSTFESRCFQCGGPANCQPDAQGQAATGCNPAITGVESQCTYPAESSQTLSASFDPVSIPSQTACGDNVTVSPEECDGNDLGGKTCTTIPGGFSGGTLSCSATCTYNTALCTVNAVKFRTLFSDISNTEHAGEEIAFSVACDGSNLTKAGEYTTEGFTGTNGNGCSDILPTQGYTKILNIGTGVTSVQRGSVIGTANVSLWRHTANPGLNLNEYVVAANQVSPVRCAATGFRSTTPTITISNLSTVINPSTEAMCPAP